jgi:ParB family chromosome partitioning protein
VREEVASGRLSMGHARALLAVPDESGQRRVAREVIAQSLSVRETETLVKRLDHATPLERAAKPTDVHVRAAEDRLKFALGTRVRIIRRGKGGKIEIDFTSEAELQRLFEVLTAR